MSIFSPIPGHHPRLDRNQDGRQEAVVFFILSSFRTLMFQNVWKSFYDILSINLLLRPCHYYSRPNGSPHNHYSRPIGGPHRYYSRPNDRRRHYYSSLNGRQFHYFSKPNGRPHHYYSRPNGRPHHYYSRPNGRPRHYYSRPNGRPHHYSRPMLLLWLRMSLSLDLYTVDSLLLCSGSGQQGMTYKEGRDSKFWQGFTSSHSL